MKMLTAPSASSSSLSWLLSSLFVLATASTAVAQTPGMTPAPGPQPAAPAAQQWPPPAAQQPGAQQPAPSPPGYPYAYPSPPGSAAPNGQYVSPLYQQTQPSYLPQSVALSGPRIIKDWRDGEPIPYGYHREERVRKGPIISGALIFGIPYLYSAFAASIGQDVSDGGDNKAGWLYVPVLGPFLELTESHSASLNYILVLDGLAQATGAALFTYGLTSPMPVLVRNDLAMVTVTPTLVGKDGTGIAFVGRF